MDKGRLSLLPALSQAAWLPISTSVLTGWDLGQVAHISASVSSSVK